MGAPTVTGNNALLQAPHFPGMSLPSAAPEAALIVPPVGEERSALFRKVRRARVGGRFWEAPFRGTTTPQVILRPRNAEEAHGLCSEEQGDLLCVSAKATDEKDTGSAGSGNIDPWSILPRARGLVAHGDDEWVALARIAGIPVRVLSNGPYGAVDDDEEAGLEKAARALCIPFPNPFGEGFLSPLEAIDLLAEWRRVIDANRGAEGEAIVAACGMSWWKRQEIRRFLFVPGVKLQIVKQSSKALAIAERQGGALAVWPSRVTPELIAEAASRNIPLVRVEDGFVRSAGLGSNLVPPSSVIVDRQGIHFDPRSPSDLESILSDTKFTTQQLERARALRKAIVAAGIGKYGGRGRTASLPERETLSGKRIVLVPGQVENDMSVLAGGGGLASNLELLRRVRKLEPDAEIWWRPHPDVDAGHRVGAVPDNTALKLADRIVRGASMGELLDRVDAVHVLTSLTGFEALLRRLDVTCHGTPFYAGWGLTRDMGDKLERRQRRLALDELVAGVLLLYPRYLDPVTGVPCPPEVLVARITEGQMPNRQGWIGPIRRWQGRLTGRVRTSLGKRKMSHEENTR